jgi:hypothetical protein
MVRASQASQSVAFWFCDAKGCPSQASHHLIGCEAATPSTKSPVYSPSPLGPHRQKRFEIAGGAQ